MEQEASKKKIGAEGREGGIILDGYTGTCHCWVTDTFHLNLRFNYKIISNLLSAIGGLANEISWWKIIGLVALGEEYSTMKTIIQGIRILIKHSFHNPPH